MTARTLSEDTVEVLWGAARERLEDIWDYYGRAPECELPDLASNLLTLDAAFKEVCGGHWLEPDDLTEVRTIAGAAAPGEA